MSCWIGVLVWLWVCLFGGVWRNKFPCTISLDFFNWFGEEWNAPITKSQWSRAGTPSMRKPASRGIISALPLSSARDWCLFLEHPTYWYECMTSKYAQKSSRGWFWVFKISSKSQSPKTVPTCIVVLYFPHDNIVRIHICDECMRSNVPNVCRMLWSIWWQHVQVCSRSIQCLVYQCVPIANIWGQFASELLTTLQQIPFLLP